MTTAAEPKTLISRDSLRVPVPYEAPMPGREEQIADVFSRILGVTPVGANDDFYDLGGDSLLGEQISMEILAVTGQGFPISGLFEAGTPRAVAAVLSGDGSEADASSRERETLFVVHGKGGYTIPRPEFLAGLSPDVRLHMFELPGIRGDAPFPRSLQEVARAYVDEIDRVKPEGPVRLAAFCSGGLIALEMVGLLSERGRAPEALVLLDPGTPWPIPDRFAAETALRDKRLNLPAAWKLFGTVGRLPGNIAFLEPLFMRSRVRRELRILQKVKDGHTAPSRRDTRYGAMGLKPEPRAWLFASYRHAWPASVSTKAHILASRTRSPSFLETGGLWDHLLPNRTVHVIVEDHQNILSGASSEVSAAMETLLMGRTLSKEVALKKSA